MKERRMLFCLSPHSGCQGISFHDLSRYYRVSAAMWSWDRLAAANKKLAKRADILGEKQRKTHIFTAWINAKNKIKLWLLLSPLDTQAREIFSVISSSRAAQLAKHFQVAKQQQSELLWWFFPTRKYSHWIIIIINAPLHISYTNSEKAEERKIRRLRL